MCTDVTRTFFRTAVTALSFVLIPAMNLRADEPSEKLPSRPDLPAETNQPNSNSNADDDDKLFKNLVDGAAKKQEQKSNLLENAIKGMRDAQRRIDDNDSSLKTRQLQLGVVKDLEQLIKRLQAQQAKPRSGKGTSRRPQTANPDEQNPDPSKPPKPKSGDGDKTSPDKAAESTDKLREAENVVTNNLVDRKEMASKVWGHLPPKLREKLLNAYSDTYLPKYDDLVRRYFSALAEEGRAKQRP